MIITEHRLRGLIRHMLYEEKRPKETIANVSDLQRLRSTFDDWADVLLDDLSDKLPKGGKIKELSDGIRQRMIDDISKEVRMYLIDALGFPKDGYSKFKQDRDDDAAAAKRHQDRTMRGE